MDCFRSPQGDMLRAISIDASLVLQDDNKNTDSITMNPLVTLTYFIAQVSFRNLSGSFLDDKVSQVLIYG